jgi:hypothetical protein
MAIGRHRRQPTLRKRSHQHAKRRSKTYDGSRITIVLALQFQTQGIRQSEGLRRIPYNTRRATRRAVRRGGYYGGTGYYGHWLLRWH